MALKELFAARFGLEPPVEAEEHLTPCISRLLARRTHRRYSEKPVPGPLVDLLVWTALSASSKSDFQQASIIKLESAEKRSAIAAHFPAMPWIGLSPVFLVFCADPRRLEKVCEIRGHPEPQRDLEAFMNASMDAALALQTFIVAAESAGLGCCPISVIRNRMAEIAPTLNLPAGVFPVAGLCVGYPSAHGYESMRLPPSLTVHEDGYQEKALEAEIDGYDRQRAARHETPRDQQRNPARFGYADFYGWSEDKARQAAEPEGARFAAYLKKTWFSL